jgi:hypothetical protein
MNETDEFVGGRWYSYVTHCMTILASQTVLHFSTNNGVVVGVDSSVPSDTRNSRNTKVAPVHQRSTGPRRIAVVPVVGGMRHGTLSQVEVGSYAVRLPQPVLAALILLLFGKRAAGHNQLSLRSFFQ